MLRNDIMSQDMLLIQGDPVHDCPNAGEGFCNLVPSRMRSRRREFGLGRGSFWSRAIPGRCRDVKPAEKIERKHWITRARLG